MIMVKSLLLSALLTAGAVAPGRIAEPEYRLVVVSESGDIITWIRVKDGRLEAERVVPIGIMPADIDGPHNVTIAPDNKSYYVSVAHGTPYGSLWRLDAFNDTLSRQRAEVVRRALVARGIAADNIVVVGRGKREPIVATADGVAEARNRRVEILVR
jgi:hypothetical protein